MTDPVTTAPGVPRPVTPAGILAAQLSALCRWLDELHDVALAFAAELHRAAELAAGLDPYLSRFTTPESESLRLLADRTAAHDWSSHPGVGALEQEMLSGHLEGRLLAMLVHAAGARQVLELGMFTGYSALAMAEALPDDGVVVACEIDADVAAFAAESFAASEHGYKIDVRLGPAAKTLHSLAAASERFDLIFIDADKAGYADYLGVVLDAGLLEPHGLICVDNTLMQGQPWTSVAPTANGDAIASFNAAVADDPRVEQVIVPLRDGLTLIRLADGGAHDA